MYYFAYGSNMSHQQMQYRCPDSRFISAAIFKDYCFVYDGYSQSRNGAVANIIQSPGSIVWGGLYEITQECLDNLNLHEGYPNTYDRMNITVEDRDSHIYDNVIIYYRSAEESGEPSSEYRQIVVAGAKDCSINVGYIQKFLA